MPVVIMQPTYLPWVGYFDLIDQADTFIFLDNVQFQKQSWQQRNRLRAKSGLEWITIPVLTSGRFGQEILNVEIKAGTFPRKHIKQIHQSYKSAPYFGDNVDELFMIMNKATIHLSLARLNMDVITWLAGKFSFVTRFIKSSELDTKGVRSDRLISLLSKIDAKEYMSPVGSKGYIREDYQAFRNEGIRVSFQNYEHPEWQQQFSPFEPGASAIDLLFNEGPRCGEIIRSGRRPPLAGEDLLNE